VIEEMIRVYGFEPSAISAEYYDTDLDQVLANASVWCDGALDDPTQALLRDFLEGVPAGTTLTLEVERPGELWSRFFVREMTRGDYESLPAPDGGGATEDGPFR
jgi:hypothetical protein